MMAFSLSEATKKELADLSHAARWDLANDLIGARNALIVAGDPTSAKHMTEFIEWLRYPSARS
jgi:hypothetical protein